MSGEQQVLIMQYSPSSCHFVPIKSKYLPQNFQSRETKFHSHINLGLFNVVKEAINHTSIDLLLVCWYLINIGSSGGGVFKFDILEEPTVMHWLLFPWRQEADHNGYGCAATLGTSAGDWATALTLFFLFPAAQLVSLDYIKTREWWRSTIRSSFVRYKRQNRSSFWLPRNYMTKRA